MGWNRTTIWVVSLLTVLGVRPPLRAQRFSFERYGEPRGLTDLVITDLHQDKEGYLWVATFSGLFRYDGTSFQRFGPEQGVPVRTEIDLLETPSGQLWAAADRLLLLRNGNSFVPFEFADRFNGPQAIAWQNKTQSLMLASNGGLATWKVPDRAKIGTGGRATAVFDPVVGKHPVYAVYSAADRTEWYSTGTFVCRLSAETRRCFGTTEGLAADQWTAIVMDGDGDVWARSEKRIARLRKGAGRFESLTGTLPPADGVGSLQLDREGHLFVPTQGGLARLGKNGWRLTAMRQGMSSDSVRSVLEDREGSLWIGHLGAGLERWRGYKFWEGWTELEGLPNSSICAVEPISEDELFVGTDRGLVQFQPSRGVVHTWLERDGLVGEHVMALARDESGDLWIGSDPGGLSRLDHKTNRIQRVLKLEGGVRQIAISRDGLVWVGTHSGLFRVSRFGRFPARPQSPPGAPANDVSALSFDSKGRLWVVAGGELSVYADERWEKLHLPGLDLGSPLFLGGGLEGTAFVLTDTAHPYQVTGERDAWVARPLPALSVSGPLVPYFIGVDRENSLWVGTGRGAFVLTRGSAKWRWHTENDGLIWNDTNIGGFHAGLDRDVWIGTSRGLAHYTPAVSGNRAIPPPAARISAIEVNGRVLDASPGDPWHPLSWKYPATSVQVRLTALTFLSEASTRFLYRRRGLDKEWLETRSREIVYSDLRPGTYIFDVLAESPDGTVSREPATATLTIEPPWYMTRPFAIGAVWAALTLIICGLRWRTGSLLERQKELEAAVLDRTKQLQQERKLERKRYRILELITSSASLDEVIQEIAGMLRTYPNGLECSIRVGKSTAPVREPGYVRRSIRAGSGEIIGCIDFRAALENFDSDQIDEAISIATGLAAVAIESRSALERLDFQAHHDSLTELPNRLWFKTRLHEIFRDAAQDSAPFAVFFIDLDRFKQVNDVHGHRIGDLYLQEIAKRFRSCMRPGDLLARLGGDEFAAILPGVDSPQVAHRLTSALMASLDPVISFEEVELHAGASIGFSLYPQDAADPESLLRAADQAMYRVKESARAMPSLDALAHATMLWTPSTASLTPPAQSRQ